jgi:alpha-tubulin suppressor-like RCC1 family protein
VPSPVTFTKLSVGLWKVCALTQDGVAYCWGGTDATPTAVATDLRFIDISVGNGVTCGISTDGKAYCWGNNANGSLGTGEFSGFISTPVAVNSTVSFVKVIAGNAAACALDSLGAAFCWGKNTEGELGDGSTTDRASPSPTVGGLKFTTLSLGTFHTCGIATDGYLYCWGYNPTGELGIGREGAALVPTRVAGQ